MKATKMQKIILSAFRPGVTVEWHDIMKVVEAKSPKPIKNWLTEVRGPLQGLRNDGVLVRVPDVHIEGFILVVSEDELSRLVQS